MIDYKNTRNNFDNYGCSIMIKTVYKNIIEDSTDTLTRAKSHGCLDLYARASPIATGLRWQPRRPSPRPLAVSAYENPAHDKFSLIKLILF